ncbi:MAG: HEAT repeat domain-containing protein, partial [Polyangiaceae bacterium]
MGLFDRLMGGSSDKKASPAAKWADRMERRAQNYDRQEAITALSDMGTPEAVELLLKRFTFHMDPSITDQEEKDAAFQGVLRAGTAAIEPIRAFAARAESLAWPMKIARELLEEPEFVEELLRWLARWDTEYSKFVDPKVQILTALEEHKGGAIREGVERFLEDVNEPSRFHAVNAVFAQDDVAALPALLKLLVEEESVRVRTKIVEGLAAQGWEISADQRQGVSRAMPAGYTIDAKGHVAKR